MRKLSENLNREQRESFGILFIDIDRFKFINDVISHDIGDLLLIKVAERIINELDKNDIICRFGGDEFTVLVNCESSEKLCEMASKIINKCSR
jgi:diguanylate cyclase (GGDEF)-like protein